MDPRILPWIALCFALLGVAMIIITEQHKEPMNDDRTPLIITHGDCDQSGVGMITISKVC